jgi:hypothetical protein
MKARRNVVVGRESRRRANGQLAASPFTALS